MNLLKAVQAHYMMIDALAARGQKRCDGLNKGMRIFSKSGITFNDFAHVGRVCDATLDFIAKGQVSGFPKKVFNNRFAAHRANRRDSYRSIRELSQSNMVQGVLFALRALKRRVR